MASGTRQSSTHKATVGYGGSTTIPAHTHTTAADKSPEVYNDELIFPMVVLPVDDLAGEGLLDATGGF